MTCSSCCGLRPSALGCNISRSIRILTITLTRSAISRRFCRSRNQLATSRRPGAARSTSSAISAAERPCASARASRSARRSSRLAEDSTPTRRPMLSAVLEPSSAAITSGRLRSIHSAGMPPVLSPALTHAVGTRTVRKPSDPKLHVRAALRNAESGRKDRSASAANGRKRDRCLLMSHVSPKSSSLDVWPAVQLASDKVDHDLIFLVCLSLSIPKLVLSLQLPWVIIIILYVRVYFQHNTVSVPPAYPGKEGSIISIF